MRHAWKAWLLAAVMIGSTAAAVSADISFKWEPYARVRYEYWNNIFDLTDSVGDERSFYRLKLSLSGQMEIDNKYTVFGKLTNESRMYMKYDSGNEQYNINEAVFDNLYVDIKNVLDFPVGLRIGRQDLLGLYGEGFLISDGTPYDGSRTFYFNAVKASWKVNDRNTLDALCIKSYQYDQFIGINKQEPSVQINKSDEDGYILYHKADPSDSLHWENYFIRKDEWSGYFDAVHKVNTVGSFAKYTFSSPLTLKGQAAYQFGDVADVLTISAWGGYAFAELNYKEKAMKPWISAGYIYLSGDDLDTTDTFEAFNVPYSRFPWISELLLLNSTREFFTYYLSNISVARITAAIAPFDKAKLTLGYNRLNANQQLMPTNNNTDRGTLITGRIDYAFTRDITAYLLSEYFQPGQYYRGLGQDDAVFVRTEMQFKF